MLFAESFIPDYKFVVWNSRDAHKVVTRGECKSTVLKLSTICYSTISIEKLNRISNWLQCYKSNYI